MCAQLSPTTAIQSTCVLSINRGRKLRRFLRGLHLRPSRPLRGGDFLPCICRHRTLRPNRYNLLLGSIISPKLRPTRSLCSHDPRTSCRGQFSGACSFSISLAESCERRTDAAKLLGQPILFLL